MKRYAQCMAIFATFAAALAFGAAPALASYGYYGQGNYRRAHTAIAGPLEILTGNEADNGTCEGMHTRCGVYLCAYAYSNGKLYGSEACGNDSVYHPYGASQYLFPFFDEYAYVYQGSGEYIYGTVFY